MANDYDPEQLEALLKRGQEALDRSREALSHRTPSGAQAASRDSLNANLEDLRRQNAERFALNQKIHADVHGLFMNVVGGGPKKRHESSIIFPQANEASAAESSENESARTGAAPANGHEPGAVAPKAGNSGHAEAVAKLERHIGAVKAGKIQGFKTKAEFYKHLRIHRSDFGKWQRQDPKRHAGYDDKIQAKILKLK